MSTQAADNLMIKETEVVDNLKREPRKWSEEEIALLKKFYPKKGGKYVASKLNRTHKSVIAIAVRLGIHRQNFRKWSEWEVRYLKKYYGVKTASSIARTLGRTVDAIQIKSGKLGLRKQPVIRYTAEEKQLITELYESGKANAKEIAERLNKPISAIRSRINRWGLRSPVRWTKKEWNYLKNNYHRMTAKEISKRLKRSERAIVHYANRHGLSKVRLQTFSDTSIAKP